MEGVAWITVCQFDRWVEDGFVLDWIIDNYTNRPTGNSSSWLSYYTNATGTSMPVINKDLVSTDLYCHLPTHTYFDISNFLDFLHEYHIECKIFREDWRYILLLDENGTISSFTMDLVEPNVALMHDRIDFDVSDLSLEKDCMKELGIRVDIQHKSYLIELETIVDHIKKKRFQVLCPVDDVTQQRIDKMQARGWV
ncbi:unnamed protein product [Rotaria sordida]|uniref:Uncharacterized protein n=1 Tax=Rotaria sordida TaxID=392033 RepID=A0A813SP91_9BILA|nr:unnamed protein product [Rotaria sordida]CAF1070729.1 unnamed protein product [Rotaria sordida]